MSLKWCKKNLDRYSQAVYDLLRDEHPDVVMEVSDCTDVCSLCTDVPFALRNGAIVSGRDPRGLYVKLKRGMSFLTLPALPGTYAAVSHSSPSDPSPAATE
ncbi:MAG: YuzB family protein [Alicyclobacillus sp.]|nr:YuzB family protein [Alicyclobacillus sp.]